MDAVIGLAPLPFLNVKPAPVRWANVRATWRLVTIGVLLHEPARADVRETRQARHLDAADRLRRALQKLGRRLQPGPPDRALAVLELELRRVADDRQHRPAHAQHDIADRG